jgi:hypothetical protein
MGCLAWLKDWLLMTTEWLKDLAEILAGLQSKQTKCSCRTHPCPEVFELKLLSQYRSTAAWSSALVPKGMTVDATTGMRNKERRTRGLLLVIIMISFVVFKL